MLVATLTGTTVQAQTLQAAPRLVVNITIDELRNDYIEHYSPLYTPNGFKKLLQNGCVYNAVSYPFDPVDRASAIATVVTGTTPFYHHIIGTQWLDRNTLRLVFCVDDTQHTTAPQRLSTSTISDELKVSTNGAAIVYGLAAQRDAAVLSAGHAADGAFWIDNKTGNWTTSSYYGSKAKKWLNAYSNITPRPGKETIGINESIAQAALACITNHAMGKDAATDFLSVVFSAATTPTINRNTNLETVYRGLDHTLATLITKIEQSIGKQNVLFVLTSTGYTQEPKVDYAKYRIPTGTFYINRAANLLNMYLGAIYGQSRYVETCFNNQIYLNRKLIEDKLLSYEDVVSRSKDFLTQIAGVRKVCESPYSPSISGDLLIEVAPGWQLLNEDNHDNYISRVAFVPFPIILYGANIKPQRITTPVTVDQIAPTIANAIQIRAPNACNAKPLPSYFL